MYYWYKFFTYLFYPLSFVYLFFRKIKNKEHASRYKEKLSQINIPRKEGYLLWFHVASVGEAMSILPLIENDFKLITLTFVGMVFTAVILKEAQSFSRIWYFSNFFIAVFLTVIMKLIFDYGYEKLIQSNVIQRNILLVGDSTDCYGVIKKFRKSKDISIIKALILTDKK